MSSALVKLADLSRRAVRKGLAATASRMQQTANMLEAHPLLTSEQQRVLQQNSQLKDCHRGRRAFVVGNGPSLNQQDLTLLRDELVFVVNGFWRHPILQQWQPVALSFVDPGYFTHWDTYQKEFQGMRDAVHGGRFFVPLAYRDVIREHDLLPEERTFYFAFYANMARVPRFGFDLTRPVPGCQTVSLFAIMAALHMGCEEVYLTGMDHDLLATTRNPTHFYPSSESKASKDTEDWSTWSYEQWMVAATDMFRGYRHLRSVAESQGRRILNATAGGFLDVFPRVEYESLFHDRKREAVPATGRSGAL